MTKKQEWQIAALDYLIEEYATELSSNDLDSIIDSIVNGDRYMPQELDITEQDGETFYKQLPENIQEELFTSEDYDMGGLMLVCHDRETGFESGTNFATILSQAIIAEALLNVANREEIRNLFFKALTSYAHITAQSFKIAKADADDILLCMFFY